MKRNESFVREWWDDVRYENGGVRIRHPEWTAELVIDAPIVFGRATDIAPQTITIHYHNSNCGCENGTWDAAVTETRNTLYGVERAMAEKDFLEEVLRDRKSKGIHELHNQTPIGRLIDRQHEIIYHRGRYLKKSVTREELEKVFGRKNKID